MVPASPLSRLSRLEPAITLAEIAQTLQDEPLITAQEIKAFYCKDVQPLRGIDRMGQMRLGMEDALSAHKYFRAFFLGHPGVGKTTELGNLLLNMASEFRPLRISVLSELNPGTFRFYDLLLLILLRLVQAVQQPMVIGFRDSDVEPLFQRVRDHLSSKWTKHLRTRSGDFGAGLKLPFLSLFGNLKLGASKQHGEEEYEVSFVSELVQLTNDVFAECNELLNKHQKQSWILVVEDFEKIGLAPSKIRETFIGLRPSLQDLNAHILVTIPIWLRNAEDASIVLPANYGAFLLPDLPVYDRAHSKDEKVVATLAAVVTARVQERLFDAGVLERCCIASGGNIRDLFSLIREAMLSARLRKASTISAADADGAVISLRNQYKQYLGSTGQNPAEINLDQKLDRLTSIYKREDPTAEVPDRVLYQLLQQRCVLQYNGNMWMGVHPLVVDLLMDFKKLLSDAPGGSRVPS